MNRLSLSRTLVLLLSALSILSTYAADETSYAQPLRISYNDDWSPYSYQGRDNQAHGILVDLLEEALV